MLLSIAHFLNFINYSFVTILVFILAIFACTPIFKNMLDKKNKMSDIIILVLFILSIVGILASSYNPFIYFRF